MASTGIFTTSVGLRMLVCSPTSLDNMSSSKVLEPRLLTVVQADMPEEMQQEVSVAEAPGAAE